jgi:hypothetical protein
MARKYQANFNELSGVNLRNETGATRAIKSYNNRHKDKSGNFGYVIVFNHGGMVDAGYGMKTENRTVFELSGAYASDGTLYNLRFGDVGRCSSIIPEGYNYTQIIQFMNIFIKQNNPKQPQKAFQFR